MALQIGGHGAAQALDVLHNGVAGALADGGAVRQIHAAHAGLGGELDELGTLQAALVHHDAPLLGQGNHALALGGGVAQGGEGRILGELLHADAADGDEVGGHAVAVSNGAGLVEDHGVHVAAGLDGLTAHGDDVEAGDAVHAGDADGGEQSSDGGGDQAHRQGDQGGHGQGDAAVAADGVQGDDDDHEDDGQGHQQDLQGDLVGGLLAGGALHQGDHLVQEGLAGVRGDADLQPVGHHSGAAGDGGEVAAGLAEHGGGLAGDGGLIHAGGALDDLAVVGDDLTGADHDHVALLQLAGGDDGLGAVGLEQTGLGVLLGLLQALGLGLAAALGHRLGEVGEEDGDKEDDADKDVVQADIIDAVGGPEELGEDGEQQSDDKADLNHKHDRIVHHIFGVQLGERPDNRGLEDVLCYEFGPMLIFHRESVILL